MSKKFLLLFVIFLSVLNTYGYKVYLSTGHLCKDEVLNLRNQNSITSNIDGLWCMPWNWRQDVFSDQEKKKVITLAPDKPMVVEIDMGHINFSKNPMHIPQLLKTINAGAKVTTLMLYNEGQNGSMLTAKYLKDSKKYFKDNYMLISNIREWRSSVQSETISMLDGFSFEFNISENINDRWAHVVNAVKWGLENNKKIYLLTPPGKHLKPWENNKYIKGYKAFFSLLESEIGSKLYNSDNIIFVPSNYNFNYTKIHYLPLKENGQYANTVGGACQFLIDKRNNWHQ